MEQCTVVRVAKHEKALHARNTLISRLIYCWLRRAAWSVSLLQHPSLFADAVRDTSSRMFCCYMLLFIYCTGLRWQPRPYPLESTGSRPISAVKPAWACAVLKRETLREKRVLWFCFRNHLDGWRSIHELHTLIGHFGGGHTWHMQLSCTAWSEQHRALMNESIYSKCFIYFKHLYDVSCLSLHYFLFQSNFTAFCE